LSWGQRGYIFCRTPFRDIRHRFFPTMPVWWGNNGFQWGWVMRLFRGFAAAAAAAAACVLPLAAGPVGAQQGSSDAQRLDRVTETIRTRGSEIPGTKGAYICTVQEGLTVINVTSYKTGGVKFEKQVGLYQGLPNWQKVADNTISTGNHTLYLANNFRLSGGVVSIKPTYKVVPEGQKVPILSPERSTPFASDYIRPFELMTQEERLNGMEEAVRIACRKKSPETIGPVLQAFAGTQNG